MRDWQQIQSLQVLLRVVGAGWGALPEGHASFSPHPTHTVLRGARQNGLATHVINLTRPVDHGTDGVGGQVLVAPRLDTRAPKLDVAERLAVGEDSALVVAAR